MRERVGKRTQFRPVGRNLDRSDHDLTRTRKYLRLRMQTGRIQMWDLGGVPYIPPHSYRSGRIQNRLFFFFFASTYRFYSKLIETEAKF